MVIKSQTGNVAVTALEEAFRLAATRALRRRAAELRRRAAVGITVIDAKPPVVIVESKAAHLFKVARDWDRIVIELEGAS